MFSLGTLLAILSQALLTGLPGVRWLALIIAAIGIAIQLGAAWIAERASLARVSGIVAKGRITPSEPLPSRSVTHHSSYENELITGHKFPAWPS